MRIPSHLLIPLLDIYYLTRHLSHPHEILVRRYTKHSSTHILCMNIVKLIHN
jgi:hypothetical protein